MYPKKPKKVHRLGAPAVATLCERPLTGSIIATDRDGVITCKVCVRLLMGLPRIDPQPRKVKRKFHNKHPRGL